MDHSEMHHEDIEENVRLIVNYQIILIRQLEAALKENKIDEVTYQNFKRRNCTAQTREEIFDYFAQSFEELAEYYRDQLRKRIHKGALMLDSMSKDHPKFEQFMTLYDELCNELKESDGRGGLGGHS